MRRGFKFGSFAASAVVDFKGQISSLQQNQEDRSNPSEMKSGPSFWFDRQTADDFQKLPAKVCMRTLNVCVCVCVCKLHGHGGQATAVLRPPAPPQLTSTVSTTWTISAARTSNQQQELPHHPAPPPATPRTTTVMCSISSTRDPGTVSSAARCLQTACW